MSRYNRCKECYNMKCIFVTGEREDFDTSECPDFRPLTNADRIRSMSDYDMADWIASILSYHSMFVRSFSRVGIYAECDSECPLYKCCNDQPTDNIEGWLKSPVEVGE